MFYLGQPYSHINKYVVGQRYMDAVRVCASLFKLGHFVYSPIVHWHNVAVSFDLAGNFETWRDQNLHALRHCETFAMLMIPGWDRSAGLRYEFEYAKGFNLNLITISILNEDHPPALRILPANALKIEEVFNGQDNKERGPDAGGPIRADQG